MWIDPKTYCVVNDKEIKGFFGPEYRWLSNFHICSPGHVFYDGMPFISSENAYQASKIAPVNGNREKFINMEPKLAKKEWKKYPLLDKDENEWNSRKYEVMVEIVFNKFLINKDLRAKLLETGDRYLEETNCWSDQYWGVDIKKGGLNNLGKILMKVRGFWK